MTAIHAYLTTINNGIGQCVDFMAQCLHVTRLCNTHKLPHYIVCGRKVASLITNQEGKVTNLLHFSAKLQK